MSLTLHYHPLSSFCQKVLIALYEANVPFTPNVVDLMDEAQSAALRKLWPMRKFPVLSDGARVIAESTTIIEYLALHHGAGALCPGEPQQAVQVRAQDRFCDWHLELPMQKIVTDRLRPPGAQDAYGVEQARAQLRTAYGVLDAQFAAAGSAARWIAGEQFSMADCAAVPGLFYGNLVEPFAAFTQLGAYYARLAARPSVVRVQAEAQPYLANVPK